MLRRAPTFLVAAIAAALLLGLFLQPPDAMAGDVPAELSAPAAAPTSASKALSRPFIRATRRVLPSVVKILNYQKVA